MDIAEIKRRKLDMNGNILVLRGQEVQAILRDSPGDIIGAVSNAYRLHAQGESSLPHSTFLRFPSLPSNRIIALPAYLGGETQMAGIKWIASAPANIYKGIERASAIIVLNDPETGLPWAILEGSAISAARTAASAALAANTIHSSLSTNAIGLIGCGRINFEVAHYLQQVFGQLSTFMIFDLDEHRMQQFRDQIEHKAPGARIVMCADIEQVLEQCSLISLATTASTPHIADLSMCPQGTTILNISLRDIVPQLLLEHDNIVDDLDHVCRAQTSVHLAEQLSGTRDFVRCSLGDILIGRAPARRSDAVTTIFSPFGLGILDIAVAKLVCETAIARKAGLEIDSFLPSTAWNETNENSLATVDTSQ